MQRASGLTIVMELQHELIIWGLVTALLSRATGKDKSDGFTQAISHVVRSTRRRCGLESVSEPVEGCK